MSEFNGTLQSPKAIRDWYKVAAHHLKEIEQLMGSELDSILPFRENQCADSILADQENLMSNMHRLVATLVFEKNNPNAPKIQLL